MSKLSVKSATVLCMALFMVEPIHLGSGYSRIAEVQSDLGLSKSPKLM